MSFSYIRVQRLGGGGRRKGEERLVSGAQVTPSPGCELRSLRVPPPGAYGSLEG